MKNSDASINLKPINQNIMQNPGRATKSISVRSIILLLIGTLTILTSYKAAAVKEGVEGKYITIGNHKLFVDEQGPKNAKVTIVFESGAGGTSRDWVKVRALLPSTLHSIAYDRAGLGKSEAGPLPRTLTQEVFELHELLNVLKIKGQIILAGQSMGGLSMRLFNKSYGKNVAGMVLVDPAHENGMLGSMKYGGWVRLREKASGQPIPKPQIKLAVSPGYDSTVDYTAEEFQNIYLSVQKSPQELGHKPLIVIGAGVRNPPPGTPDDQWKQLRAERDQQVQDLTVLSANAKFILASRSSHGVQNDEPEIVAQAIKTILDSIK